MAPNIATMCLPSVTGVELACVDFVWRLVRGVPLNTSRSHCTFPVARSSEYTRQLCRERFSTGCTSPYNPVRNDVSSSLAAATAMTWLPQMIGLEVARPGIGVFQSTFLPVATSHSVTAPWPSAPPAAFAPRKAGHGEGFPRVGETALGTALGAGARDSDTRGEGVGGGAGEVASAKPSRSYLRTVLPRAIESRSTMPPRPEKDTITSGALSAVKRRSSKGRSRSAGWPSAASVSDPLAKVTATLAPVAAL